MNGCQHESTNRQHVQAAASEAKPIMKVFLVGVGCVGKTTIGGILAQRLGYPFFDLDVEIERHFGQSIERLRERFGYEHTFWQETAPILSQLGRGHEDVVVALVPSGLRDAYLRALKKLIPRVVVAIEDEPDNILARITFFDIDSKPMKTSLTKPEKRLYLKEIKKDITYFRRSYRRADLRVDIAELDAESSAEKIELALRERFAI